MIGKTLAHYNVTAKLGAGGMGEVYRANDTRLGRDVAIKVLPAEFAADEQRLSRLEREAQLLASLNHPNIAAIHGLEESDGQRFLVLELVEGETLGERLRQGAIPVDEALPLAVQITQALEAAHDKGVVHRDLKPANIKITPDGKIKVLDFGLAKAFVGDSSEANPAHSPTISMTATGEGVILGTAAYMSPEQARGQTVDKRTDIWAFGCVLYEMLAGRQLFGGATVTDIIAAVVRLEPDWDALPADTPSVVRSLLRRCLEKESDRRLRDIGDARIELADAVEARQTRVMAAPVVAAPAARGRERIFWGAVTGLLAAALVLSVVFRPGSSTESYRYMLPAMDNDRVFALSPDGRYVVRSTTGGGLWLRQLDQLEFRMVPGTELGRQPFWSPDSRWIGFIADGELKKVAVAGGPALRLSDVGGLFSGGTWNADGTIVFSEADLGGSLFRVADAGGEPVRLTTPEPDEGETFRYIRPRFLPDGRQFLFLQSTQTGEDRILIGSLDSTDVTPLVQANNNFAYSSGYLLFLRESTLMAQAFDSGTVSLDGDAFPVADDVQWFSTGGDSQLIYRLGTLTGRTFEIRWFDRNGQFEAVALRSGPVNGTPQPVMTPAGDRIAFVRDRPRDVWIYDVARGIDTRFTFDEAADVYPILSPDGSQIVFSSLRDPEAPQPYGNLYVKAVGATEEPELLLAIEDAAAATDWSRDGRYILYTRIAQGESGQERSLWALPLEGDQDPILIADVPFDMRHGKISPDGNWVAYVSGESEPNQVYIEPFPGTGRTGKWQISADGGQQPVFSADGRTLYFLSPESNLMSVNITLGDTVVAGVPEVVLNVPAAPRSRFSVTEDEERFLFEVLLDRVENTSSLVVETNWLDGRVD